jgi:hypothetical protein
MHLISIKIALVEKFIEFGKKIALVEKLTEFGLPRVEISFLISLILQGIIRNMNLM